MKIKNMFCNNCQNKTDHILLFSKELLGSEELAEDVYLNWSDTYKLYECNGCHEVQLEKIYWFSEWDGVETRYFPPRVYRKTPKWINDIPEKQKTLLKEVYIALAADCISLVLMGSRTLIDLFITDKIGDVGTFIEKLNRLEKNGFVSAVQKRFLSSALNAGNAVIHRGYKPTNEIVNQVLDIIEHLLISYSLEKKEKKIKKATPQRRKTKKP
jgi:hypothetical protein